MDHSDAAKLKVLCNDPQGDAINKAVDRVHVFDNRGSKILQGWHVQEQLAAEMDSALDFAPHMLRVLFTDNAHWLGSARLR